MSRAREALHRSYRDRLEEWELRLAARDTNRVVRPFEWGVEWTRSWPGADATASQGRDGSPGGCDGSKDGCDPGAYLCRLGQAAAGESERFFSYRTPSDFRLTANTLRFTSAVGTPSAENNTAYALWFPAPGAKEKAVIVLPQWNSKLPQHVRLCHWLNLMGISALRLSLPYHDARMPPELERADYAVSANIARTVDAGRQAVIDTRSCLDWLESQGYRKFGIVGTSLGSCYAFLTSAHDDRLRVNVFNLYSFYFADVVWNGLSTRHIRQGMDGQIDLRQLQEAWKPITPQSYAARYTQQDKKSLFLSTAYDTTFLPEYSKPMIADFRQRGAHLDEVILPCGHYTLGQPPFQLFAGYHICAFLKKWL